MVRATELAGRAVIDIDAAEKVGTLDKLILDPDGRRVAGFVVTRSGSGFPHSKDQVLIPAASVRAIGPDAITIKQSTVGVNDVGRLESLPRGSDLIGRKIVSEDGRFLGKVSDVLIDRTDGRIVGYLLSDHTAGKRLEEMGKDSKRMPYLPADAKLKSGRDLIVASEDAVRYDWTEEEEEMTDHPGGGTPMNKWGYTPPPSPIESAALGSATAPVVNTADHPRPD
jgi:sporulation protein YlmC with PRC-barrel domain